MTTRTKTILLIGAQGRCEICGIYKRLIKTNLGWMCAVCAKRFGK